MFRGRDQACQRVDSSQKYSWKLYNIWGWSVSRLFFIFLCRCAVIQYYFFLHLPLNFIYPLYNVKRNQNQINNNKWYIFYITCSTEMSISFGEMVNILMNSKILLKVTYFPRALLDINIWNCDYSTCSLRSSSKETKSYWLRKCLKTSKSLNFYEWSLLSIWESFKLFRT